MYTIINGRNCDMIIPQLTSSCGFVPHGPMDKASAYGAEDSRFDPWCGSHVFANHAVVQGLCFPIFGGLSDFCSATEPTTYTYKARTYSRFGARDINAFKITDVPCMLFMPLILLFCNFQLLRQQQHCVVCCGVLALGCCNNYGCTFLLFDACTVWLRSRCLQPGFCSAFHNGCCCSLMLIRLGR